MAALSETPIRDEHSVLLWQACAYADDLREATATGRVTAAHDAMMEFLHHRLLPYLGYEERELPPARLRDDQLHRLLVADHERLRADVQTIEASRTSRVLLLAVDALLDRLDRHLLREESWLTNPSGQSVRSEPHDWALPLLFTDVLDLETLPPIYRDALIRRRLAWMRPGDAVLLQAGHDLHELWRRLHACSPNSHSWVYVQEGPDRWQVRVTRRPPAEC